MDVLLIAYDDAKRTFGTLAAAYTATAKPGGVGDDAYVDKQHAIHVLKGKVRYYIKVATGVIGGDKQALAIELAKGVAAQLGAEGPTTIRSRRRSRRCLTGAASGRLV